MGGIGQFFAQFFGPLGNLFHVVFYLPIYNVLILLYEGVHLIFPSDAFPAFAVSIFLLTIVIRLCLYPLTKKQLQSSRATQALAPQVQELQRRYKNNPQELMAAQQALYREHGVSMYGGCLPLLIQMPFLYGLYYSLYTALLPSGKTETIAHHLRRVNDDIYPFLPHLTQLPNTHFLWTNLAQPDHTFILPILAGLFTFIQLRMAQPVKKPTPAGQRHDTNTQIMGSMQFVMPFFTFIMAMNFPSGLAFYWAISTAFSGVQQYFLTGFGSLFVGIPGLEHLVPEPQSPPTLPSRPAASSAMVDATPPAERPSGLAGFLEMLRQNAAARETQRASAGTSGPPASNGASGKAKPDTKQAHNGAAKAVGKESAGASAATNGATNRPSQPAAGDKSGARRVRPANTAPVLVKRTQPAATPPAPETDRIAVGSATGAHADAPPASAPASAPRPPARPGGNGTPHATKQQSSSSSSRHRTHSSGSGSARRRSGSKSKGGK